MILHLATRKALGLLILALNVPILLSLSGLVGLQENNLPSDIKLDELRLLRPENLERFETPTTLGSFDPPETKLQQFNNCVSAEDLNTRSECSSILEELLNDRPADGRLWLEMARLRSRNYGELDDDTIKALQRSYDYAPRESWITRPRTAFVLSVWSALPHELQDKASQEIDEALSEPDYVSYLAGIYKNNPLSRARSKFSLI